MHRVLFGSFCLLFTLNLSAEPIVPPFVETFDDPLSYSQFTIINANNDDAQFEITEGAAKLRFSLSGPSDDWLVLPAMKLNGGSGYSLSFDAYCEYAKYAERFEVKVALQPTAEALSKGMSIVAPTVISNIVGLPYKCETLYTPPTDDIYYIGIHGCSDENSFFLYIDNVSVSEGISAVAPAPVSAVSVVPDEEGKLKSTLYYTAPSKDFAGADIKSLEGIRIYRDETLLVTQHPTPGQSMSYIDEGMQPGEHIYSFEPYNAAGIGEIIKITAFIGFNRPVPITGFRSVLGDHPGQACLSWEPVTKDIRGLTYPEGSVTYNVLRVYGYDQVLLAKGLTETSYVDDYCEADAPQVGVYYTVVPVSAAGEGLPTNCPYICMGKAYDLPFNESFKDGDPSYDIWVTDGPGAWSIKGDYDVSLFASQDKDDGMVCLIGSEETPSDFMSGRISLEGVPSAVLTFYTLAYTYDVPYTNRVEVLVDKCDGSGFKTAVVFDESDVEPGSAKWIARTLDLDEWVGGDIRIAFRFYTDSHPISAIDNISVSGRWSYNLSVGQPIYPVNLVAGIEAVIPVTISNIGKETASDYSVVLYRNDEIAANLAGSPLKAGESVDVEFKQTATSLWNSIITYRVVVDYELDERIEDNSTAEKEIGLKVPLIHDLRALMLSEIRQYSRGQRL